MMPRKRIGMRWWRDLWKRRTPDAPTIPMRETFAPCWPSVTRYLNCNVQTEARCNGRCGSRGLAN